MLGRVRAFVELDAVQDYESQSSFNSKCLATVMSTLNLTWIFEKLQDAYGLGMQTIVNGSVSVDTFFLMSGLLVSFLLLRELDRTKGKFNVGLFYLHRYLRLTPVYAVILGFVATLMVYLGTGPNWYNVNLLSNACRISWWRQFLYSKFEKH